MGGVVFALVSPRCPDSGYVRIPRPRLRNAHPHLRSGATVRVGYGRVSTREQNPQAPLVRGPGGRRLRAGVHRHRPAGCPSRRRARHHPPGPPRPLARARTSSSWPPTCKPARCTWSCSTRGIDTSTSRAGRSSRRRARRIVSSSYPRALSPGAGSQLRTSSSIRTPNSSRRGAFAAGCASSTNSGSRSATPLRSFIPGPRA